MTRKEWKAYRVSSPFQEIKSGEDVIADYHWNYGTTQAQRERNYRGRLDIVDERGVIMDLDTRHKRFSYKVIVKISIDEFGTARRREWR